MKIEHPIGNNASDADHSSLEQSVAEFVRGFFLFLEERGMPAVVLHGGEDGFERRLSDIDFGVCRRTFIQLPVIITEYCTQAGWQLCQILRHETTASYFVCSAADDPSCAVALDACSDYQRNGTVLLTADDLLASRQPLDWGGHGLLPANELRYRFAKAAVKSKEVATAQEEFARYPEEIRQDCAAWLNRDWKVTLDSWDLTALESAFSNLRAKTNRYPSLTQAGGLSRILSRFRSPAGLVVIAAGEDFDIAADQIRSVFGHLYFRRFRRAESWNAFLAKDLIASTLIIVPNLQGVWSKAIPGDCIYRLNPTHDTAERCKELARYLHGRCAKRANLAPQPAQA